jgi:hypothetical protein
MPLSKSHLKSYLAVIFSAGVLGSSALSFAATWPCEQSIVCVTKPLLLPENTQQTVNKQQANNGQTNNPQVLSRQQDFSAQSQLNALQNAALVQSQKNAVLAFNPVAFYMENLRLTLAQSVALAHVIEDQIPAVEVSMKNLEEAHAMLRNMALNKQYDQAAADVLVDAIAKNTAQLGLLQAQREYEVFTMLNPEQIQQYHAMVSQIQ